MNRAFPSEKIRLFDIILPVSLIVIAVFLILFPQLKNGGDAYYVTVSADGNVEKYALDTDQRIGVVSFGHSYTVVISSGEVSVSSCDCEDRVCMNTRPISADRPGSIVCVPGHLLITVGREAVADGAYDSVAGK